MPLGTAGFLLEVRTGDESFGELKRVLHNRVDNQPLVKRLSASGSLKTVLVELDP